MPGGVGKLFKTLLLVVHKRKGNFIIFYSTKIVYYLLIGLFAIFST